MNDNQPKNDIEALRDMAISSMNEQYSNHSQRTNVVEITNKNSTVNAGESKTKSKNKNKNKTPKQSALGGYYDGPTIEAKTDEEINEVMAMTQRTKLYQRSARHGQSYWDTVTVYEDGIDFERRKPDFDDEGNVKGWQILIKKEPTIWTRPVYPVSSVLVHTKNDLMGDEDIERTSERKIRWKGRDFNSLTWSEAVISTSFDATEIKTQKAEGWMGAKDIASKDSTLLRAYRIMILNDKNALWRNPEDPIKTVPDDLPVEHLWKTTGWCTTNKYSAQDKTNPTAPVWHHILPGHSLYAGSYKKYTQESGDKEVYIQTMKDLIARRPLMGMWCAMAAGSFAHGLYDDQGRTYKGDTSTMVNMHGQPGHGKSTTFEIVMSMICKPKNPSLFISHSTDTGVELVAESANHSFFVIDEIQKHLAGKKQDAVQHLMGLLNGIGKTASANSGTNIRDQRTFDNLILATGNNEIEVIVGKNVVVGNGQFAEALHQRVVEVDATKYSPFPSYPAGSDLFNETQQDIKDTMDVLSANYGWLYDDMISYYKNNRNEIVDKLRHTQKTFGNQYPEALKTKAMNRKIHFFAYTLIGIEVVSNALGLGDDVIKSIETEFHKMIYDLSKTDQQRDDENNDDCIEKIISWCDANSSHFAVRTTDARAFKDAFAWPVGASSATRADQIQNASWRSQQAEKSLWGYFVQNEELKGEGAWSGELWITHAGKQAMETSNNVLPFSDLLPKIIEKDWLDATKSSDGKITRNDKKIGSGGYVYKILIGKARQEISNKQEEEEKSLQEMIKKADGVELLDSDEVSIQTQDQTQDINF